MHVRYSYLLFLILTLLLAACGGQGSGEVNGNWTGTFSSGSSIALQLTQSGSAVEGKAIVAGVADFPATLTGTYAGGRLSLSGQDNVGAVNVEASVSSGAMQGNYAAIDPATNTPITMTFSASR